MNIQLNTKDNPFDFETQMVEYLLYSRDVGDKKYIEEYVNVDESALLDPKGLLNMEHNANIFLQHMSKKSRVSIICDPDFDGSASLGIINDYIRTHFDLEPNMIIHEGKSHGIHDVMSDVYDYKTELLIVPDAGTNDVEECQELMNNGIDVIVLDHHNVEYDEVYEHVVNPFNHGDTYENKGLSGCGVTYKFISYVNKGEIPEYYELVGLSLLSDSMTSRTLENRFFINKCLESQSHPFIKAIKDKNAFSLGDKEVLTVHDMSFSIIPPINAMHRVGTVGDKKLMAKAFSKIYEESTHTWRGKTTEENTYTKSARVCNNTRSKQSRVREKDLRYITDAIDICSLDDNNVIIVNSDGNTDANINGLTAMDITSLYKKPSLIGSSFYVDDLDTNTTTRYLSGSARAPKGVDNLKSQFEEMGIFKELAGHEGAFGWTIKFDDVGTFLEKCNSMNFHQNNVNTIYVDDIINCSEVDPLYVRNFVKFDNYVTKDIDAPHIYVKDIQIMYSDIEVMGKNEDTMKVKACNCEDITFIMFKCDSDNEFFMACNKAIENKTSFTMNAVCIPSLNIYKGLETEQMNIVYPEIVQQDFVEHENDEYDLCGFDVDDFL